MQRDLSQGIQEIELVLQCGNELINGRENARGCNFIRSQIESIAAKWDDVTFNANERQRHLEEAIAKAFHRDITSLQTWLTNTEKDVDRMNKKKLTEREVEKYIHVRAESQILVQYCVNSDIIC